MVCCSDTLATCCLVGPARARVRGGGGVSSASYASSAALLEAILDRAVEAVLEQRTRQAGERDYAKLRELKRWREEGDGLTPSMAGRPLRPGPSAMRTFSSARKRFHT